LSTTASDYICEISSLLDGGYPGDCVTHACRLAELLFAERKNPWIGRVRDVRQVALGTFHGPLTPIRLLGSSGPTWTTHYLACEDGYAYDPLVGRPVLLTEYAVMVFGRALAIDCFLDVGATAELCRRQELPSAFRVQRVPRQSVETSGHGA
jgi:hypothetical protein